MTGLTQELAAKTAHELSGARPSGPHVPALVEMPEEQPAVHPLRAGWLPEGSGVDWLEELRVEHEDAIVRWHRLATNAESYPARCSQVTESYRAAVRAAIEAEKAVPKVPDAMHPERRLIESQELEAATRAAEAAVTEVARRVAGVLLERRGELDAAGEGADPLRRQLDEVIGHRGERVALAMRRAALLTARDETRNAFVALRQGQDAESEAVALRNARRASSEPVGDWKGGFVVEETLDPTRRRAELEAARTAGRDAESALNQFDTGEACAFRDRRPPLLVALGLVEP